MTSVGHTVVKSSGYQKRIIEWKPRDSGGGFIAAHVEGDPVLKQCSRNEKNQLVHGQTGNVFVDTAYHFGLLLKSEGFPEMCVISMYSTALRTSRNWNTTMHSIMKKVNGRIFNPPMYSHAYRLFSVGQTRDQYDWVGWSITSEGEVKDVELYKFAREFSKQIESGAVRVTVPPQEFEESAEAKEEVPF